MPPMSPHTWYLAPEDLFESRDYSNLVIMWALGMIMAELCQP